VEPFSTSRIAIVGQTIMHVYWLLDARNRDEGDEVRLEYESRFRRRGCSITHAALAASPDSFVVHGTCKTRAEFLAGTTTSMSPLIH